MNRLFLCAYKLYSFDKNQLWCIYLKITQRVYNKLSTMCVYYKWLIRYIMLSYFCKILAIAFIFWSLIPFYKKQTS